MRSKCVIAVCNGHTWNRKEQFIVGSSLLLVKEGSVELVTLTVWVLDYHRNCPCRLGLRRKVLTCLGDPSRAGKKIVIPSQGIGPAFSLRILHATES